MNVSAATAAVINMHYTETDHERPFVTLLQYRRTSHVLKHVRKNGKRYFAVHILAIQKLSIGEWWSEALTGKIPLHHANLPSIGKSHPDVHYSQSNWTIVDSKHSSLSKMYNLSVILKRWDIESVFLSQRTSIMFKLYIDYSKLIFLKLCNIVSSSLSKNIHCMCHL